MNEAWTLNKPGTMWIPEGPPPISTLSSFSSSFYHNHCRAFTLSHTHSHACRSGRMRAHTIRLFPLVGVATATVGEITLRMAASVPADAGQVPGFLWVVGCLFLCGNPECHPPPCLWGSSCTRIISSWSKRLVDLVFDLLYLSMFSYL